MKNKLFAKRSHYISIKNLLHKQSEKSFMCFKTRRASVRNFTVQSAIKSATTFLEKSREVVLEKWFFKLEFFFMVNHFSRTRKKIRVCRTTFLQTMWITGIHPPFFWSTTFLEPEKKNPSLKNHFSRPRFHKPDFLNQISWTTFLHLSRKVVAN